MYFYWCFSSLPEEACNLAIKAALAWQKSELDPQTIVVAALNDLT